MSQTTSDVLNGKLDRVFMFTVSSVTNSSFFNRCLIVLRSSADVQLYDSEFNQSNIFDNTKKLRAEVFAH